MLKIDKEGIPKLVQKVEYSCEKYVFKLTFFNGKTVNIEPGDLIRYPPHLCQSYITKEQLMDAYIAAEQRGLEFFHG